MVTPQNKHILGASGSQLYGKIIFHCDLFPEIQRAPQLPFLRYTSSLHKQIQRILIVVLNGGQKKPRPCAPLRTEYLILTIPDPCQQLSFFLRGNISDTNAVIIVFVSATVIKDTPAGIYVDQRVHRRIIPVQNTLRGISSRLQHDPVHHLSVYPRQIFGQCLRRKNHMYPQSPSLSHNLFQKHRTFFGYLRFRICKHFMKFIDDDHDPRQPADVPVRILLRDLIVLFDIIAVLIMKLLRAFRLFLL